MKINVLAGPLIILSHSLPPALIVLAKFDIRTPLPSLRLRRVVNIFCCVVYAVYVHVAIFFS